MNAPSVDIKDIITAESSLGLTFGTDLFIGRMPEGDDFKNIVCIYDAPGQPPQLTFQKGTSNLFYSSFIIKARNIDYRNGYTQLKSITEFLHAHGPVTINSTQYSVIKAVQDPQFLEWDGNNRAHWIVNFDTVRKASS